MYLIFDTETTGLPKNYNAPVSDLDNWPRLVQIAWQLHDNRGKLLNASNRIIKPEGFTIPYNATKIHGISTERALMEGEALKDVLESFAADIGKSSLVIGHNVEFDINVTGAEFLRSGVQSKLLETKNLCTKLASTDFVAISGGRGGKFKWPTLTELHIKLFGIDFEDAHDAAYDVNVTAKCFFGLIDKGIVESFDGLGKSEIQYEEPILDDSNFNKNENASGFVTSDTDHNMTKALQAAPFAHLHVHSQFSVLQATADIKGLISKVKELGMDAVALTDLGNMMGVFQFVKVAIKEGIKPVVGCEFFVAEERLQLKFTKDNPDKRFNQVLIAKNKDAYHRLAKLSSLGFLEGLYGLYPRIDKSLIKKYSNDLIALSGGLNGELPGLILNEGKENAEEALKWWLEVFGENYYLELIRHGLEEENYVNEVLLEFAKKYNVKVLATNEVYYLNKSDANAHDILLCVKEGELRSTEIGKGRSKRYGFPNNEYYLKSPDEMKVLFRDVPEAITNISDLLKQVEVYSLERDVLLPAFQIPKEFQTEDDYLRHLAYKGAKQRYGDITDDIKERLDYELEIIKKTGYPGYFLIVQDFTGKAREMGVTVGPGRGSAAGSVVAYCTGITNVDPIKYDLLFERFLNPDRVSLPDIDIDFDDEGRGKVIDYVVEKYGKMQVAQIITYGTMAAKSSIRDVSRVMELPLADANILAKMIPEQPGISLKKAFESVSELKKIKDGGSKESEVLNQATILEGSLRNTGTHACGVIITPSDMTELIPVCTAKDAELLVTQFDNNVIESAGMLKMDFLGLKTLTIINHAIDLIAKRHGIKIKPDEIPLDDPKTYLLYQRGDTNGTFQFESPGMQKHLRALKPDRFGDLIAMNALYRPGPMEYIPNFIRRKQGQEQITYDIPEMAEYLEETYGITVYQEQVMLLSQKLAGFTKGQADSLRKAMGKKIQAMMDELKPKFLEGCKSNGHDVKVVEKIWNDWEAFAKYAFNKSHSTCYSVVAFHTAYLKANYPAEYMASVLTNNMNDIKKVTFFMEECNRMHIPVLGPDVNESDSRFTVNERSEIRFGLAAIKGAGENAVQSIIEERNNNGLFSDFFDFVCRVNIKSVNKKTFESLAKAGAFDCFKEFHRRQYLYADEGEQNLIEIALRYASRLNNGDDTNQVSLFGNDEQIEVRKPEIKPLIPFNEIEKLNIEKEVVGFYISGHPLDMYKNDLQTFTTTSGIDLERYKGRDISIGGIIVSVNERVNKRGNPFGLFTIENYESSHDLAMFGEDYLKYRHLLREGVMIVAKGKVQQRYNQEGIWEFRPNRIELLNEIRNKQCTGIQLEIELTSLDKAVIDTLKAAFDANPGTCDVKINVHDAVNNLTLTMQSQKFKVQPSDELIGLIDGINNVSLEMTGQLC